MPGRLILLPDNVNVLFSGLRVAGYVILSISFISAIDEHILVCLHVSHICVLGEPICP